MRRACNRARKAGGFDIPGRSGLSLMGHSPRRKELIAGYTLIRVKSREEALDWARRFPNPLGEGTDAEIEVRQLFELDDFKPSEAVERFREMEAATKK